MRITSLEIENFRCFGTRTRVDFAPITLLFGANSVGKSSILGALDLLRVLMSEVSPTITEDRCVGTFADLGGFHSMVHDHNGDRTIKLRLSVDLSGATTEQDIDDEDAPLVTEESRDPLEAVDDALEEVWVECALTWSHVRGRAWVSSFSVGTVGEPESLVEIQSPGDRRHPSQLSVWLQHPLLNPELDEDGLTELERALEEAAFNDHRRFETDSPTPVLRHALSLYGIGGAVPHRAQPPRLSTGSLSGPLPPAVHTIRQLLHRTVMGIADRVREALAEVVRIGPLRVVPPRNHQPRRHTTAADWFDGLAAWDELHSNSASLCSDVSRWMESIGTGYWLDRRRRTSYSFPLPATIWMAEIVVDKVRTVVDFERRIARPELHRGGRCAHEPDAGRVEVERLMGVTPADAAHARMTLHRKPEFGTVEQPEPVERGRIHRDGRVMQEHERVRLGPLRERAVERGELARPEPALAVGRFRIPGVEQHDLPAVGRAQLAADLERLVGELPAHFGGVVVVARDHEHRHLELAEQQVDRAVGGRFVVHDVAGDDDGIGREPVARGVLETGTQARQGVRAAQRAVGIDEQVGIGELHETHAARAATPGRRGAPGRRRRCRASRSIVLPRSALHRPSRVAACDAG